jgi:micrococcal nuclease
MVTIIKVTDGDTMDIRYRDGRTHTLRLLGVDTPETYGS